MPEPGGGNEEKPNIVGGNCQNMPGQTLKPGQIAAKD
jgi:hypothetical protein